MVRMNELAERASFTWFPVGLTTVYACLEFLNILHHSMWRDEIQVWMLGRHSHSIAELIYLKRYDGHPDAWFVLVYLITKFTHDLRWMQVVHAAVATATVYAIARYSPFTRMQKILMAFCCFLSTQPSAASTRSEFLDSLFSAPFSGPAHERTTSRLFFFSRLYVKPAFMR